MKIRVDIERARSFFASEEPSTLPPRRRAAWDVGDVLRQIIDRLVDTRATTADLEAITEQLRTVSARLGQFDHGRRYDSYAEASVMSDEAVTSGDAATSSEASSEQGPPSGHADFSPLLGRANPLAPPMEFAIDGEMVSASVTFGHAYEGPPGHVHGGIVAAAFDEILGAVQALSGSPGMTGRLTVDYRAPTPLHVPLRFEATLDGVDGRKITTSARLFAGDTLCAEATGLFISVDFSKIAAMRADRDGSR